MVKALKLIGKTIDAFMTAIIYLTLIGWLFGFVHVYSLLGKYFIVIG